MKHIKLFEDFRSDNSNDDREGSYSEPKESKPDLTTIGDCITTFEECMLVIDDIVNEDLSWDMANYDINEMKKQAYEHFGALYKRKVIVTINDIIDFIDDFEETNR